MHKKELLQKYLAGRTTHNEERELYKLLQKEDGDNDNFKDISYQLWEKISQGEVNVERQERMYQHIARHTVIHNKSFPYLKWAAAVSLLLTAASLLFYFSGDDNFVYETARAEQRNIQLPDGTTVALNESSKLHYPDNWQENGVREVWLEGEAFFTVSKQASPEDKPIKFIVHAGELDIIVLGTAFNVQSSPTDVQVVLSEGAVRLENSTADLKMEMEPGEMVAYSSVNQQAEKRKVKTAHFSAWKDGRYVFEGLTLEEVSQVLWHNYGKEVKLETEALKQRRISATIPSTDLQVLLAVIKEAMEVNITQQGDTIVIR